MIFHCFFSMIEFDVQFAQLNPQQEHGRYSIVLLPEEMQFMLPSKAVVGRYKTAYLSFQKGNVHLYSVP